MRKVIGLGYNSVVEQVQGPGFHLQDYRGGKKSSTVNVVLNHERLDAFLGNETACILTVVVVTWSYSYQNSSCTIKIGEIYCMLIYQWNWFWGRSGYWGLNSGTLCHWATFLALFTFYFKTISPSFWGWLRTCNSPTSVSWIAGMCLAIKLILKLPLFFLQSCSKSLVF